MTKSGLLAVLRIAMAISPVFLTLAGLNLATMSRLNVALVLAAGILSAWGAFSVASTDTPRAWLQYGLRSLHAQGASTTERAQGLIRRAKISVKILDTYWGAANQFRPAIEEALRNSSAVIVNILLVSDKGCISRTRDAAMPGEVNVQANLASCLKNIEGMRLHIDRSLPGSGQRIEVRRYDAVVMGPVIIVDDKHVIAGTFLQSGGSPTTPAFEFVRRPFGSNEIVDHFVLTFDRIWRHSMM